jgi:hypothetical protein
MPEETTLTATTQDSGAVPNAATPEVADAAPDTKAQGESPTTDTATTAADTAPLKEDAKPVVPETYEFKMPDGTALDASAVEIVSPVLKKLGVSQEGAQELADAYMGIQAKQVAQQSERWLAESRADKEIGGAKWDETTRLAQKAFAEFATPELKALVESTGLGNHPALLKTFVALAKRSAQDTHIPATASYTDDDRATRLFPNTK